MFPKQAEYRKCIGKDKTGEPIYDAPVTLSVRYCGEKVEAKTGDTQSTEHYGIYHSHIELIENSKLDGKRIDQVSKKPDIFGNVDYYRIRVV